LPGDFFGPASRPPERGICRYTLGALLNMRAPTHLAAPARPPARSPPAALPPARVQMPARPRSNAPAHPPRLPAFKCARALLGSAAKCASPPTRPPACVRAPARATRAPAPGPLHLVLTFDTARRRLRRRRLVSALDQPQHLWCAIPRAPASHCRSARARPPTCPACLHSNAP
jgi:hypothetical protein